MKLYDRWTKIATARADELALVDLRRDRSWTFAGIQAEIDQLSEASQPILFPRGMDPALIFETLRGWRDGKIVCPVDDVVPSLDLFTGIPKTIAHAKAGPGSWTRERVVLFEAAQIAADCDQIVNAMGLTPERPNLGVLSMAHSYGFSNLVLPLLLHGILLYWRGDSLPGAVTRALDRIGPATLPAVPAMWHAWHDTKILTDRDLLAISAGAPLSLTIETELFEETGIKIHNFYGASECGGIAYDASEIPRSDSNDVGTLLDNVHIEKTAEGFRVSSPSVGTSYWPQGTNQSLAENSFHLRERIEVDESNRARLVKRRRDLINVAGRKVYPHAVELAIDSIEGVRHCVVFGVKSRNPERVEEVAACIQLEEDIVIAEIRRALRGKLMRYEIPLFWWEPPELSPDLDIGVSREELRAHLRAHQSKITAPPH